MKTWSTHVEFVVLFITLLGGFFLIDGRIERQCARTDKLYEIYAEQQRVSSEKYVELNKEMNQKFYDLLKQVQHERKG